MKTGTVKFSKEFVTSIGLKEWVGIEMEYDMNTECPRDVLTNAKTIIEQWHNSNQLQINPEYAHLLQPSIPPGPPPIINVDRTPEDIRVAQLIKDIYACTELDGDNGLLSYGRVSETNKDTQNAFAIMFRKLNLLKSQNKSHQKL
jgi:hypothetical protein